MRRPLATASSAALLAATLVTGSAALTLGASAVSAATVPSGFTDTSVASVTSPTAVETLGDGRVVVLDQNGRVRIYRDGVGLAPGSALSLTVCGGTGSEMGLLGFAPDRDFAATGDVFVYYTARISSGCVNRVSKFTMSGDTIDPASEQILLDNMPGTVTESAGNHNGGDLEVGSDGHLYVSVGDSGSDPRNDSGSAGANDAAQDLSILSGKILRITTDGGIPSDNPYVGAGTASCATAGVTTSATLRCQEIFAHGLRNPYRFAFDPNAGSPRFFINDVGQGTREEVDEGIKGANYGWNAREGQCPRGESPPCAGPPAGVTDPLTDYPRSVGTYITAGAFVPNGIWPAAFDGGYLFADGGVGKIFFRDAAGNVDYATPFATGAGVVADMAFVPEGDGYALYYTDAGAGALRKITYTGTAAASGGSGLRLVPVTPKRVYDTRNGIGVAAGLVRLGTSRVIDVQRPDTATEAVLANLTFTDADGPGFGQAWPTRTKRPTTSVINTSAGGEVVANSVVLPVAADGTIIVSASVTTHVLVDVLGYFTSAAGDGGEYRSLTPTRLVDTRQPAGTPLGSGSDNPYATAGDHLDVQIAGKAGVPSGLGGGAIAFILTALGTNGSGYATAYPSGTARPTASNVNTGGTGDVRANLVVVPVGADGKVSLFGFNTEDLIVDVAGYFTPTTTPATNAGRLTVFGSTRVVDTRQSPAVGFAALEAGGSAALDVTPPLPDDATAVVQNLTIPDSSAWGFVTATPEGSNSVVSNLNVTGPGQTRAALAITDVPASGRVRYSTFAATSLVVDVYGYFR